MDDALDPLPRSETDLEAELEALRDDIVRGGPVILNHRMFVSTQEMEDRFEQIMSMLPKEVRRARRICKEEQNIIQDAKDEARRLLEEARAEAEQMRQTARDEADRLVEASAIRHRALEQSEQILAQAEETARQVRENSYAYARQVVGNMVDSLKRLTDSVERDRAQLEQMRPEDS